VCSIAEADRPALGPALRGVLAETALTGVVRFEWRLLLPLLHRQLDAALQACAGGGDADPEVGPPRPWPDGDSPEAAAPRLHAALQAFPAAPFTLRRLCELLLDPGKQYRRQHKLALAVERLLTVTTTLAPAAAPLPPPSLAAQGPVNDNPRSPYLFGPDGERLPPLVAQPQPVPNGTHAEEAECTYYAPAGAAPPGPASPAGQGAPAGGPGGDGRPPLPPLEPAEAMQAQAFADAALGEPASLPGRAALAPHAAQEAGENGGSPSAAAVAAPAAQEDQPATAAPLDAAAAAGQGNCVVVADAAAVAEPVCAGELPPDAPAPPLADAAAPMDVDGGSGGEPGPIKSDADHGKRPAAPE
jgi:serine/threonine-protein phosphatase 4 regulatory subunit 2